MTKITPLRNGAYRVTTPPPQLTYCNARWGREGSAQTLRVCALPTDHDGAHRTWAEEDGMPHDW